jgi:uncharacterized protein (TIGR02646 family)
MKYIEKQSEPSAFTAWKNLEYDTLQRYYERGASGSEIWDFFPSSCPPNFQICYSKAQLRKELLAEQGSICCYCNQKIENDCNTIMEHFQEKSNFPLETLKYNNLLASCNGNQRNNKTDVNEDLLGSDNNSSQRNFRKQRRELHCDAKRGNKSLQIGPLDKLCESKLYFLPDGRVSSDCIEGKEAIEILNLNHSKLIRFRKSAIEGSTYANLKGTALIDPSLVQSYVQPLDNRNAENQFIEFCSAIKSVILRVILNQKEEL